MKKIRLDLERLEVESFVADDGAGGARGTVHGRGLTQHGCQNTANGCSSIPNPCFCTDALSCRCQ
jgi:hypothetical protein